MEEREPMGPAPMILAKRKVIQAKEWCPEKSEMDFDNCSDPHNPKTIQFRDIMKAHMVLKKELPITHLMQSHRHGWGIDVYFKLEIFRPTRNYHERGALYSLLRLTEEERLGGVVTASHGNFAMALAYHGKKLGISVAIVLAQNTNQKVVEKCVDFGAMVMLRGKDIYEARKYAYSIFCSRGFIYMNGFDNPHVIAGAGVIAVEVLKQLPETDVILVPVDGGGLLAGICVAAKHLKPEILVYGVEPQACCSFYKAMQSGYPYKTSVGETLSSELGIAMVGYNAFHTAKSLVDKLVLVDDDTICKAMFQLAECQKLIVDAAGAVSLAALLSTPNQLPELIGKTVVCLVTASGFVDIFPFVRKMSRALALEGRLIKLRVVFHNENSLECSRQQKKLTRIISGVGAVIMQCRYQQLIPFGLRIILMCGVKDLQHACNVKHVVEKYFPNMIEFIQNPFSSIPICFCYPKRGL